MLTEPNLRPTWAELDALRVERDAALDEVEQLAAMEQDRDRLSTLADDQTTEIDCYRRVLERIRDLADAIDHGDAATTSARTIALKAERVLALEQWDGSVPPGGYVCAICRVPVESEPCPDHSKAVTDGG